MLLIVIMCLSVLYLYYSTLPSCFFVTFCPCSADLALPSPLPMSVTPSYCFISVAPDSSLCMHLPVLLWVHHSFPFFCRPECVLLALLSILYPQVHPSPLDTAKGLMGSLFFLLLPISFLQHSAIPQNELAPGYHPNLV